MICDKEPYKNLTVYGPYVRKDGRYHVIVYNKLKNIRKTVSYPKYLMEIHLGRFLDPITETIDHKDCNFLNNEFSNLRILSISQHAKEDALRVKIENTEVCCVWCKKLVKADVLKQFYNNSSKNRAGPFCGRSCAGKYGAEIQNHRMRKINPLKLNVSYVKVKK